MIIKKELNEFYEKEYKKADKWHCILSQFFDVILTFGNKNFEKQNENWTCYYFPIFVLSIENFVDLNLKLFNETSYFEFFIKKNNLNKLNLDLLLKKFKSKNLQIYGGEDCLVDFAHNLNTDEIKSMMIESNQNSFGFCFDTELNLQNLLNDIEGIFECYEK